MFAYFKNKKIKKAKEECYNDVQLELQYTFLQLCNMEYRIYRIEECTPEFIAFIEKSGFNYKKIGNTIEFLDGDENKYTAVLKCSLPSFKKRIDFLQKDISELV